MGGFSGVRHLAALPHAGAISQAESRAAVAVLLEPLLLVARGRQDDELELQARERTRGDDVGQMMRIGDVGGIHASEAAALYLHVGN